MSLLRVYWNFKFVCATRKEIKEEQGFYTASWVSKGVLKISCKAVVPFSYGAVCFLHFACTNFDHYDKARYVSKRLALFPLSCLITLDLYITGSGQINTGWISVMLRVHGKTLFVNIWVSKHQKIQRQTWQKNSVYFLTNN